MYQFKQSIEDHITQLEDGFERYGDEDTPFLLRGGDEKRAEAEKIHRERDRSVRQADERTNEPVTRDLEEWEDNVDKLDFPHIDTIPHDILEGRADNAAGVALNTGLVEDINNDVDFCDDTVFGRYLPGINRIKLDIENPSFLACRRGPVLAHEVGHAVYDRLQPDSGIESGIEVFETTNQQQEAEDIARRLHGPFKQVDTDGLQDRSESEAELFAYVFASLCIEADAAIREAPNAVSRVERLLARDEFDARFRMLLDL